MIKLAFNNDNKNLVFKIDSVERVAVGGAGIKEYYKGTLVDTSTSPDTSIANFKVQVQGFESQWTETPIGISGTSTINNQTKSVTPATTAVNVTPDAGFTGLDKVTVAAAPLEEATATPTTASQEIVATGTGNIGLSKVTVAAVTAAIDANIVAGNIKKDVVILGVTGTYEGE